MAQPSALAPLFDVSGRRIPSSDIGAPVNPASARYALVQPAIDYSVIHGRISEHIPGAAGVARSEFEDRAGKLLERLRSDVGTGDIARGVHVPFFLPMDRSTDLGRALEQVYLPAVGRSYTARYPKYGFKNELKGGLAGKLKVASGSRYEALLAALASGPLVGVYFPLALSGFSVDAALRQLSDLPDGFVATGGCDAAAALVGCPELVMKEDGYPPQLDLAALEGTVPRYAYHFAPYGYNLTFNGRYHNGLASDYCSSGLTWISQKS
jgi:hypothetical protein